MRYTINELTLCIDKGQMADVRIYPPPSFYSVLFEYKCTVFDIRFLTLIISRYNLSRRTKILALEITNISAVDHPVTFEKEISVLKFDKHI
jgi:hypothetical protein